MPPRDRPCLGSEARPAHPENAVLGQRHFPGSAAVLCPPDSGSIASGPVGVRSGCDPPMAHVREPDQRDVFARQPVDAGPRRTAINGSDQTCRVRTRKTADAALQSDPTVLRVDEERLAQKAAAPLCCPPTRRRRLVDDRELAAGDAEEPVLVAEAGGAVTAGACERDSNVNVWHREPEDLLP